MTYTLSDLTYRLAVELGIVSEGTATGGSTTTTTDTTLRTEANDYWNGGTLWVLKDAAGAGAAPQGEYARVSDFATTGGIITHATVTSAVAVGDVYAVAKRTYPLVNLIQVINQALDDLGHLPNVDITSLTGATDQTEYTLPVAANLDLRQVWLQRDKDDSDDNRWILLHNWYIQNTTIGSGDTLVFPYQIPTDYDLKLVYAANHTRLQAYGDKLHDSVPLRLVIYQAAAKALRWYKDKHRVSDDHLNEKIKTYEEKADRERASWRVRIPPRTQHVTMFSAGLLPPTDDVTKVSLL